MEVSRLSIAFLNWALPLWCLLRQLKHSGNWWGRLIGLLCEYGFTDVFAALGNNDTPAYFERLSAIFEYTVCESSTTSTLY
jgi:hypothetical protein